MGALLRVGLPVRGEVGAGPKGFPALLAAVRHLPGVDPLVQDEFLLLSKGFPAIRAGKRFFSSVGPPMPGKARVLGEALPALGALVRSLSLMDPMVGDEVGEVVEGLPAIWALVGSFSRVISLVASQAVSPAEGLPTLWAFMGLLLGTGHRLARGCVGVLHATSLSRWCLLLLALRLLLQHPGWLSWLQLGALGACSRKTKPFHQQDLHDQGWRRNPSICWGNASWEDPGGGLQWWRMGEERPPCPQMNLGNVLGDPLLSPRPIHEPSCTEEFLPVQLR